MPRKILAREIKDKIGTERRERTHRVETLALLFRQLQGKRRKVASQLLVPCLPILDRRKPELSALKD